MSGVYALSIGREWFALLLHNAILRTLLLTKLHCSWNHARLWARMVMPHPSGGDDLHIGAYLKHFLLDGKSIAYHYTAFYEARKPGGCRAAVALRLWRLNTQVRILPPPTIENANSLLT